MQTATTPVILASGSTARRTLLAAAGVRFEARAADLDEAALKRAAREAGDTAEAAALRLAEAKAAAIAEQAPGAVVIGADQILVCGDTWYDKPADLDAARAQLLALRGRDARPGHRHGVACGPASRHGATRKPPG